MPTVPVKMRVRERSGNPFYEAGGPPEYSAAGTWYVYPRHEPTEREINYIGLSVDANAEMRAFGFDYGVRPLVDPSLVTVNITMPETVHHEGYYRPGGPGTPRTYTPGSLIEGTITYPDKWRSVWIGLIYGFSDPLINYFLELSGDVYGPYLHPGPLGTVSSGPNTGTTFNASRVRATGDHTFQYGVQQVFQGVERWDGNFYTGEMGQVPSTWQLVFDWGGSSQTVDVPPGTPTWLYTQLSSGWFDVFHNFPTFGGPVTVYIEDGDGQRSSTCTLWLPPICKAFLVEADSPLFYFDFRTSYDVDSGVATPNQEMTGPNAEGLHVLDLTNYAETIFDDIVLNYSVRVSDNKTPMPMIDSYIIPLTVEPIGHFGAHIDHTKTLFTAVDGITVYRFPIGAGSRETAGTIAGYKFPSLWGDTKALYCSGKSASSGEYHVFRSYNRGKTWTQITTQTMWGTNYKKGIDCGVPVGGGAASVALLTVDSNTQKLFFKYAPDGKTWPPDDQAVEIATLTGANKIKGAQVRQVHGSMELRVTDGALKVWRSFKHGITGSWALIP